MELNNSKGAIAIWEAVKNNTNLKTLELTFNPIGERNAPKRKIESLKFLTELHMEMNMIPRYQTKTKKVQTCENFSNIFRHNKTLIYTDFLYWVFTSNEYKIMNEGLKHNHTLLGLHFISNQSNVDSLGFLKSISVKPAASHTISRIHTGINAGHFSDQKIKVHLSSNWWICEGWINVIFKFNPNKWNNPFEEELTPKDRVYIHYLSFDNFESDPMIFDEDTGTYSLSRWY